MKSTFRIPTLVALALLACRPLLASDPMSESLRSLKGAEFEQSFLALMIDHHRNAIEMAKVVPHHSHNPAVTKLAENMTQMQQQEIETMTKLLGGSQNSGDATMSHGNKNMDHGKMGHGQMDEKHKMHKMSMSKLEAAQGAAFDQAFAKEMTKHHSEGLEMAQLAQARAVRPEVREIASKIAQEQKDDITKLKGLGR
jgi:uncharacterized protein (DUF305 family)